ESWGGKQNPLTLPTTRSSDKAQKSSATVKISAAHFLRYKFTGSIQWRNRQQRSAPESVTRQRSFTGIYIAIIRQVDKHTPFTMARVILREITLNGRSNRVSLRIFFHICVKWL
ncbi:MAG: hypothetical protein E7B33_26000, partial [Klebsiella oxytoca]|nr:hypothetical protein [Klebsiella oxytoca]